MGVSEETSSSPKALFHRYKVFGEYDVQNVEFYHMDIAKPVQLRAEELWMLGRIDEVEQTTPSKHDKGPRGMRHVQLDLDRTVLKELRVMGLVANKGTHYELTKRAKGGEYTVYFASNGKHAGKLERIATHK